MFVFVHPALKLNRLAAVRRLRHRALGRPRILAGHGDDPADQFRRVRPPSRTSPSTCRISAAWLSALLGRIRCYQDKDFWGTSTMPRHGMKPKKDFDYYLSNNMVFDTAGFCGAMASVKSALIEIPASRIVFATDYPQEIREREAVRDFVGHPRARQGRRGDPVRQRGQAPQAAGEGGVIGDGYHPTRCFSISCTGILTRSLSISARSASRRSCE